MNKKEAAIQWLIAHSHNFGTVIPNVHTDSYGGSEVDALYITNSGYVHFYEIKCSKSDFKNDFKKKRHQLLLSRSPKINIKPKYFWYVCHGFSITPNEVPEYAGLILISKYGSLEIYPPAKQAPILFNEKLTPKQQQFINKKILHRYLNHKYRIGSRAYQSNILRIQDV